MASLLAALVILTWPGLPLGIAAIKSEEPPELLTDFAWPDRMHSAKFGKQFTAGTSETELLAWLDEHDFSIDAKTRMASRTYEGVPCTVGYEVTWQVEDGLLREAAKAKVTNYGCL